MATNGASDNDPLSLLRTCISSNTPAIPTTSADAANTSEVGDLAHATHLLFNTQNAADGAAHTSIPLSTPTRFISQAASKPLDLLSVYFCWVNKDKGVSEYISATQDLNTKRAQNGLGSVTNLVFVEKLDLVTWLSGEVGEHESEFIRALDDNRATRKEAQGAADLARGDGDVVMGDADDADKEAREKERLKEIYAAERTVGDRNTVLRGIKPTDFSHVRKHAESILRRTTTRPTGPTPTIPAPTPALRTKPSASGRRPEPIILLSPSASSLLRLSNIKSFLVDGVYSPTTSTSTGLNLMHLNRSLPSIEPNRPLRFILVESPDNFKPDYWSRVVAVFTTGQQWQFKGYKWAQPAELFTHALGVYVGWRGELIPQSVKGWGRGVLSVEVDPYREGQGPQQRWRDREVVEQVWGAIEASMRSKGWGKERR